MAYESVHLENSIAIENIISVHYFQYMSDFSFPGESHDFWELVCVDRGEIIAVAGDRQLALKKGNILFHKPNEFHNVLTNGRISPSLVVIGFDCHSPCMKAFEDQQLNFTQISDKLGYTSIHYFSRQFKKLTAMTPSEYATSIRLLSEKPS